MGPHRVAAKSVAAKTKHTAQNGGGERNRTDDLLLAKQALSQLSYTPNPVRLESCAIHPERVHLERMVGLGRLELPTSRLSGVRSNQAELQAHIRLTPAVGERTPSPAFGIRDGRDTETATWGRLILVC